MELKNRILAKAQTMAAEFHEVREFVYHHAELGNQEFVSSRYLSEKMEEYGFTITMPYGGLETAFRAEMQCCDSDGPKVCFMAEYDALPGYGPNKDEVAHACGHNWIAATTLGAAAVLSQFKDELKGSIVLIGTPAEETTGGKCDLVKAGCFDDIDAAFQIHLGAENTTQVVSLAMDSLQFDFAGVAAHAAAFPDQGVNALDAVQLTFAGINALRQHMRSDARVHGIVTEGGIAVNTVPDKASCKFYIRAKKRAYLEELTQKVINCAKGAALMTGATLDYHYFENSYDDLSCHEKLRQLFEQSLKDVGVVNFVGRRDDAAGSTDVGNVSTVCPTAYCEMDTGACPSVFAHNKDFLDYVHGINSDDSLLKAVQAMAWSAAQVMLNPTIIR